MSLKKNIQNGFPQELIRSWEDSDCVNFSIALARITGWLLQVDWWTPSNEESDENNMKSLRVYVEDNSHNIFDVRGKTKITSFANNIIRPLVKKRGRGSGGILTRYYSEKKLFDIPLRVKPDLQKIKLAEEHIKKNHIFLAKIPVRKEPIMPAHLAADYTFGKCAVFATALNNITNLTATGIIAIRYNELFSGSKLGYAHSINLHSDRSAEDVWGNQAIAEIANRFGIEKYELSEEIHWEVNANLKKNSREKYEQSYEEAEKLILTYRL